MLILNEFSIKLFALFYMIFFTLRSSHYNNSFCNFVTMKYNLFNQYNEHTGWATVDPCGLENKSHKTNSARNVLKY